MLAADDLLQTGILPKEPEVTLHGGAVQHHLDLPVAGQRVAQLGGVDLQQGGGAQQLTQELHGQHQHPTIGDGLHIYRGGLIQRDTAGDHISGMADKAVGKVVAIFVHHIAPQNPLLQNQEPGERLAHGDGKGAPGQYLCMGGGSHSGSQGRILDTKSACEKLFRTHIKMNTPFGKNMVKQQHYSTKQKEKQP